MRKGAAGREGGGEAPYIRKGDGLEEKPVARRMWGAERKKGALSGWDGSLWDHLCGKG